MDVGAFFSKSCCQGVVNSWEGVKKVLFLISGLFMVQFNVMARDSYFTKQIFHESYRVNRTHYYCLKTCKEVPNYSVLSTISSRYHAFLCQAKVLLTSFIRRQKQHIEKTRQLTIQIFIFHLIYCGSRKAFHKIL